MRLARMSKRTFDTFLGTGIVGGYMSPYKHQAEQAAAMVIRLLNGGTPSETPSSMATRVPMVDWRQVRRWGIDEKLLPAETIIGFREPSVPLRVGHDVT